MQPGQVSLFCGADSRWRLLVILVEPHRNLVHVGRAVEVVETALVEVVPSGVVEVDLHLNIAVSDVHVRGV